MILNGDFYFFEKNLQGDILAVYDESGICVLQFTYDAWGRILSTSGTAVGTGVETASIFRYRGYIYDTETGFYYLQSRYYDPQTGRFISPDNIDYLGVGDELLSYNFYIYCSNDPVNGIDPEGTFNWKKLGAIVACAAIVVTAVVVTVATGGVGSVAATIAISAAITMVSRTAEVAILQGRKSAQDGDSGGDIFSDIVDSIFDNRTNIFSVPTLTKSVTSGVVPYVVSGFTKGSWTNFPGAMRYLNEPAFSNKVTGGAAGLASKIPGIGGVASKVVRNAPGVVAYFFAANEVRHLIYSIFSDDPVERAQSRRYTLR